jgi:dual specificity phosphatase 12
VPARVIDKLWVGSIHAAFNQEGMHSRGITHVLNASGLPATFPRSFTYFTVDLRDKEETDILGALGPACVFIEAGEEKGGVLVHCAGGRSRSAAFLAAYLMSRKKYTFDQAADLIKRARPVVAINKVRQQQQLCLML